MISREAIKAILHRIGILLGIAGILFVGQRLFVYRDQIDPSSIGTVGYLAIGLLSFVSAASNILLAVGWRDILRYLGAETAFRWTTWAYAVSQLAKYVPGNIFHLVGRQALGAAADISHALLAKSSVIELAIVALCAVPFALLLLQMIWPAAGPLPGLFAFVMVVFLARALAKRFFGIKLAHAVALYTLYLVVSSSVFVCTYLLLGGGASAVELPTIAGAYVLAWLAGLCTPGAPAGLGVREAVLIALLADIAAPSVILLAAVMGRVVTVLGDFEFYLAGGLLDPRRKI